MGKNGHKLALLQGGIKEINVRFNFKIPIKNMKFSALKIDLRVKLD